VPDVVEFRLKPGSVPLKPDGSGPGKDVMIDPMPRGLDSDPVVVDVSGSGGKDVSVGTVLSLGVPGRVPLNEGAGPPKDVMIGPNPGGSKLEVVVAGVVTDSADSTPRLAWRSGSAKRFLPAGVVSSMSEAERSQSIAGPPQGSFLESFAAITPLSTAKAITGVKRAHVIAPSRA
jgi:hypothetical protein